MRVYKNVLGVLALLAWSAVSLGQQQGAPPSPTARAPRRGAGAAAGRGARGGADAAA